MALSIPVRYTMSDGSTQRIPVERSITPKQRNVLQEKGAGELTKGVLGAEDVEKAEGRPAPFRKKGEKADAEPGAAAAAAESDKPKEVGNAKDDVAKAEAKETEPASAAADATAAPKKKKKKKKKAAAATEKAGIILPTLTSEDTH